MEMSKLREWWAKKQGLDGSLKKAAAAEVLKRTGWARSVGGVNPYLTLFARSGISRESVDAAVDRLEIHELPSARGCTYVLPASDFAIGLKAGQGFGDEASINTAIKHLGVTEKELRTLAERVLQALTNHPMDPRELKEVCGSAVRNLGEAGKKKGITTTLPLALGRLQSQGKIRRIPANGRLDQQRYSYAIWSPSPLENFHATEEEVHSELARRYFRWIGPASLAHFRWFSGLGAKSSKAAIDSIGAVAIEKDSDLLILPDEIDAFNEFRPSKEPYYSLVSSIDGIVLLRRDLSSLLDESHRKIKVMGDRGMVLMGGIQDLQNHGILDRGQIMGLWEYDPFSQSVAWKCFGKADAKLKAAVAETEKFVVEELGDARSFSLDSPESRAPRIKALR